MLHMAWRNGDIQDTRRLEIRASSITITVAGYFRDPESCIRTLTCQPMASYIDLIFSHFVLSWPS